MKSCAALFLVVMLLFHSCKNNLSQEKTNRDNIVTEISFHTPDSTKIFGVVAIVHRLL